MLSSCEVKNFTVSLTKGPPFLMGIQYPLQGEGNMFIFGFGLLSVIGWSLGCTNRDFELGWTCSEWGKKKKAYDHRASRMQEDFLCGTFVS